MIPIRTCVGCGARAEQPRLLRVAMGAGGLVVDTHRRLGGRGAWLHHEAACWDAFTRRRGPVRSLRLAPARAERERLVETLRAASGAA